MFEWMMPDLETDEAGLLTQVRECENLKSVAAANQAVLTAALIARRDAAETEAGVTAKNRRKGLGSEIALARRDSPNLGNQHMGMALALAYEMPHTYAALRAGHLSEYRAFLLVRESAFLSLEDRRTLDAQLCADPTKLEGWGNKRITAEAKKVAYQLDPRGYVDRAAKASEDRYVSTRPAPDCMVQLNALLPVAHGVAVYAALKKAADTTFDGRSRNQVMADTLYERVTGRAAEVAVPVDVGIVIDDEALLAGGDAPAEIEGYGPVPATVAREMIADAALDDGSRAALTRLYCHPTSRALVAMDSRRRTFPPSLARLIRLRDGGTCRTPYCNADISHIDHATPDRDGGRTTAHNGNGRCAQCNYDKEAPGWTTDTTTDDTGVHTVTVTTPTGQHYRSTAPPLPGSSAA